MTARSRKFDLIPGDPSALWARMRAAGSNSEGLWGDMRVRTAIRRAHFPVGEGPPRRGRKAPIAKAILHALADHISWPDLRIGVGLDTLAAETDIYKSRLCPYLDWFHRLGILVAAKRGRGTGGTNQVTQQWLNINRLEAFGPAPNCFPAEQIMPPHLSGHDSEVSHELIETVPLEPSNCSPDGQEQQEQHSQQHQHQTNGVDAAGGVPRVEMKEKLRDEHFEHRVALLMRRPSWVPEGQSWISRRKAEHLAMQPSINGDVLKHVYREAEASKKHLRNIAGYIIHELEQVAAQSTP